ncbi:MAG: hypothetical protein HY001_01480 [Candidatus Portnoybacteria bacterium]|nr:hypothetical protein [Candidatus Portnoybacteria bacterium]
MIFLRRILKSGWQSFRRNVLVSGAAISILIITLSLITGVLLFRTLTDKVLASLKDKVSIGVYFFSNAPENQILQLKTALEDVPGVKTVEYTSRQEALKQFRKTHKDDPTINEALDKLGGQNPLPPSLTIKALQAEDYLNIVKFIEASEFKQLVEEIDYVKRQDAIENLGKVSNNVSQASVGGAVIMGLVSFLVSFNTLRLAIHNDRQKISIMRLVGASNNFVRGPFIVQGAVYGIIAAFLTLFLFAIFLQTVDAKIETYFKGLGPLGIANFYATHWLYFLGVQLVAL